MAVCFVDIVGYTTHSKALEEYELVAWIEGFEQVATGTVVDHGGRVIKTIGDEILFTTDDPAAAAEIALALTDRGGDEDDPFPPVRAGIAYGLVVSRLGDVFGPTVNIAARLTSVARPGTVVLDGGAYAALSGVADDPDGPGAVDDARRPRVGGPPLEPAGRRWTAGWRTRPRTAEPSPSYQCRRLRRVSASRATRGSRAWRSRRPRASAWRNRRLDRPELSNVSARPMLTGDTTTAGQVKLLPDHRRIQDAGHSVSEW